MQYAMQISHSKIYCSQTSIGNKLRGKCIIFTEHAHCGDDNDNYVDCDGDGDDYIWES